MMPSPLRRVLPGRAMFRRAVLPGCVFATLALVCLIAWATGTTGTPANPAVSQTVPVTSVTRDCPPPGSGGGQAETATLSVSPAALGAGKAAAASVAGLSPAHGSGNSGTKGAEVTASGPTAPDFAAEQVSGDTGLVSCGPPSPDLWFVGTGTQDGGSTTTAYLMNSGPADATADVTVLTDAGVQSGQDNQLTVPSHRYLSVNIASQASGSSVLAVHVQTSSGQVAAAVWQDGGSGGAWLPAAASPSTQLVLPGVTAAGGGAKLLVAVPGNADARLRVTALTARGKAQPLGASAQDASGSASSSFSLSSLGASASALVISSSVPVTAAVQVPGNGIGAFTSAGAPVTGQGVVAGNPSGGGLTAGLVLSAPGAGARASITVLTTSNPERIMPAPQRTVTVQGGHTTQVEVSPPKGSKGPFAIVVTPLPGSGPLYAARTVTSGGLSGTLQSLLPVESVLSRIQLPPAFGGYAAVMP